MIIDNRTREAIVKTISQRIMNVGYYDLKREDNPSLYDQVTESTGKMAEAIANPLIDLLTGKIDGINDLNVYQDLPIDKDTLEWSNGLLTVIGKSTGGTSSSTFSEAQMWIALGTNIATKQIPFEYLSGVVSLEKFTALVNEVGDIKTSVSKKLDKEVWDRNFYEHTDGTLRVKKIMVGDKEITAYGAADAEEGLVGVTVIDNLFSTETTSALSANMGRELKYLIDNVSVDLTGYLTESNAAKIYQPIIPVNTFAPYSLVSSLSTHTGDTVKHITSAERTSWNGSVSHVTDTVKHITAEERSKWNGKLDSEVWDRNFYEHEDGSLRVKKHFVGDKEVVAYGAADVEEGFVGVTIVDNLTSTEANCALSANMGRELKLLIDGKISELPEHNHNTLYHTKREVADLLSEKSNVHEHPYLSNTDVRIANWNTAYNWGDHSTAGYALNSALSTHISNTKNPHGVTKEQVGLGNADNTSDANKPISIAVAAALELKLDKSVWDNNFQCTDTSISTTKHFRSSGEIVAYAASNDEIPPSNIIGVINDLIDVSITDATSGQLLSYNGNHWVNATLDLSSYLTTSKAIELFQPIIPVNTYAPFSLVATVGNKVDKETGKGLSANDFTNTLKGKLDGIELNANNYIHPILVETGIGILGHLTTAERTLWNGKTDDTTVNEHKADTENPHAVTKTQVGLGNVDNTSDINKPISSATQSALDLKLNKAVFEEIFELVGENTVKVKKAIIGISEITAFAASSSDTPGTGGGGASNLDDLIDVVITTPKAGDLLMYDGDKWINVESISINSGKYSIT